MGRGPPAVVNGWGDTGTGPQEVPGGPGTGLLNRGNHERHGTHSVFTQLDGVYIPSGATQLRCSTTCRPYVVMRHRDARTRRRPTEVVPAGRPAYTDPSCPVSAGPASAPATAPCPPPRPPRDPSQLDPQPPPPHDDEEEPHDDEEPHEDEEPQEEEPPESPPAHQPPPPLLPLPLPPPPPVLTTITMTKTTTTATAAKISAPNPMSPPLSAPRSPGVRDPLVPRAGGMPSSQAAQSTLEQVQSFPSGWRP